MRLHRAGDTLIEVLFAFAILSLVISVMFSGAMSSYKSAQAAQDRSVALFVAQYQADGLKTYRESLAWDVNSGQVYTFLDGNNGATSGGLTKIRDAGVFCMDIPTSASNTWKVLTTVSSCDTVASTLAPTLLNPKIQITTALAGDGKSVVATVKVIWTARNSSSTENVTNTILLTQQR